MLMFLDSMGISFGVFGFLAAVITCALPMWKVTTFSGANIVTAQISWEGLWMECVPQGTGQMQCKIYDSMLALPQDLQAARAMTVISIILGILGVLISIVGPKCTNCIKDEAARDKVMIISGIFFILAGVLVFIPVRWSANTIMQNFYNSLKTQTQELGASLYIGWISAALFLIGGAMLCSHCPPKQENNPPRVAYSAPHSTG